MSKGPIPRQKTRPYRAILVMDTKIVAYTLDKAGAEVIKKVLDGTGTLYSPECGGCKDRPEPLGASKGRSK